MTGEDDSRRAWIDAGQQLLRTGGFPAIKLTGLTALTGRTTGSFYHHFSGMTDYQEELASYFGGEQTTRELAVLATLPPRARLRRLAALTIEKDLDALHAAMRDWGTCNPAARRAVREADDVLLGFVRDALVELGLDLPAAELRAELLFAVPVAALEPPWTRRSVDIDDVLDALGVPR